MNLEFDPDVMEEACRAVMPDGENEEAIRKRWTEFSGEIRQLKEFRRHEHSAITATRKVKAAGLPDTDAISVSEALVVGVMIGLKYHELKNDEAREERWGEDRT